MVKQNSNNSAIVSSAKKVLEREIEGLEALYKVVESAEFTNAFNIIKSSKGRIVVSGMGKSGHVARKIAATLASTGTSAFFVHPGEASHGDLGMIAQEDVLILLSNSGETAELKDIIYYASRFSIPLIGIVRRRESSLVEASDVSLILPEIPEASPVEAPTTSTTMMLALGDCLAVALLESGGFGAEDFHIFHPGGKLGSQFLKVKSLMKSGDDLPLCRVSDKMSEVLIKMTEKSLGCAVALSSSGELKGIITDGDLRRHMGNNLTSQVVKDIMTSSPLTISQDSLAAEALGIMNKRNITSLCVANDEDKLEGIIHIHDILRAGVS